MILIPEIGLLDEPTRPGHVAAGGGDQEAEEEGEHHAYRHQAPELRAGYVRRGGTGGSG